MYNYSVQWLCYLKGLRIDKSDYTLYWTWQLLCTIVIDGAVVFKRTEEKIKEIVMLHFAECGLCCKERRVTLTVHDLQNPSINSSELSILQSFTDERDFDGNDL